MPDKALIPPGVLDTTGSSCAACVVLPPSSSSPWRLERMWSTHHVTRQCLRSAVLRCKELLEHFPEQLPALLEALHLGSQVPCDSSGWWLNSGVKPQKFNKRSFCLCCFYSNVWFLKTFITYIDGTLQKACRPVPYIYRPFENSIRWAPEMYEYQTWIWSGVFDKQLCQTINYPPWN